MKNILMRLDKIIEDCEEAQEYLEYEQGIKCRSKDIEKAIDLLKEYREELAQWISKK